MIIRESRLLAALAVISLCVLAACKVTINPGQDVIVEAQLGGQNISITFGPAQRPIGTRPPSGRACDLLALSCPAGPLGRNL